MRAERERLNAKIVAENLRLGAEARELTSDEELCYLILVSGGCSRRAVCRRSCWGAASRWLPSTRNFGLSEN